MITTFLQTDNPPERFCPCRAKNYLTRLTRGDADALPRAKCFWAFSPKNIALLSKCSKLCLDLQSGIKRGLFWSNRTTPHAPQGQPAISPTQSEATRRGKRQQNIFALQGQKCNCLVEKIIVAVGLLIRSNRAVLWLSNATIIRKTCLQSEVYAESFILCNDFYINRLLHRTEFVFVVAIWGWLKKSTKRFVVLSESCIFAL